MKKAILLLSFFLCGCLFPNYYSHKQQINLYQAEKTFFDAGQRNPCFQCFFHKTLSVVTKNVVTLHRQKEIKPQARGYYNK